MFSSPEILAEQSPEVLPDLQDLQQPEGDLYLRFFVESGQEFALPATGIREVLSLVPDQITTIPNVSPLLIGVLNLRGQVVWVTDIGQFLGDAHPLQTDRAEIPIITIENQDVLVGLAVNRVAGVDWLDTEQLDLAAHVPDNMAPFVTGEWPLDANANQHLRLLDPIAILRSARWAT